MAEMARSPSLSQAEQAFDGHKPEGYFEAIAAEEREELDHERTPQQGGPQAPPDNVILYAPTKMIGGPCIYHEGEDAPNT